MSKEYIEREALLKDISETVLFSVRGGAELPTPEMRGSNKVIDRIKSAPTADVVEVWHGHWILEKEPNGEPYCFHCSVCDEDFRRIDIRAQTPYCPHCGAKMDGGGEGE